MRGINPAKLIKIKRKPKYKTNQTPFLDAMIFEIDNTSTTISTTGDATTTTTTTKKQSFISRLIFIHPPPSPLPSSSPSSSSSSSSSSVSLNKRRPLLKKCTHSSSSTNSSCCSGRFAELAGGTTAECAAICCCCPCGLVNLLYLTIYKVPAGLCRRALRRKRRKQMMKEGLLQARTKRCRCGCDETEIHVRPGGEILDSAAVVEMLMKSDEDDDDEESDDDDEGEEEDAMMKLEKEMWETFYSTGFWRSPSQRETATATATNVVKKDSSNMSSKVKPL